MGANGSVCGVCDELFSYPDGSPNPMFCPFHREVLDNTTPEVRILILALAQRIERFEARFGE